MIVNCGDLRLIIPKAYPFIILFVCPFLLQLEGNTIIVQIQMQVRIIILKLSTQFYCFEYFTAMFFVSFN